MLQKLKANSLETEALFRAEAMSLNMGERDTSATLTLGPDATKITPGDWIQDLENPGKGIVYRARSIDRQLNTATRTVTLEHAIKTLADIVIPGEVTGSTMGGTDASVSARTAFAYVLGLQSDWVLGDFEYSVSAAYKFDGDTLLSALETISGTLEDCIWEYDFSRYPFRLHVRKLSDVVDSEMRAGRNLQSIKYSVDRSRMYTRFYPAGKENLRLSGDGYVSRNEAKYGRIDHSETDQSKGTEAELRQWAEHQLRRHARPSVTVTISGLDLSAATNEPLDRFTVGHKCRVAMPEIGETVIEKVTKLSWRDKTKDFRSVQITLADALQDVQTIVREEQRKSSGGGRAAAKVDEENKRLIGETASGLYSYIIQTSTHIMTNVTNILTGYSTIEQTASQISAAVVEAGSNAWGIFQIAASGIYTEVGNMLEGYSTIEQTASSITLAVTDASTTTWSMIQQTRTNILSTVHDELEGYSTIEQTASSITLAVNKASTDTYRSVIRVTSTQISMKVGKGEVISSINQTAESITIQASKIDLSGYVTASSLETVDAKIDNLKSGVAMATYIRTNQFLVESSYMTFGGNSIRLREATIGDVTIHYLGTASS